MCIEATFEKNSVNTLLIKNNVDPCHVKQQQSIWLNIKEYKLLKK